ncbi:MAG: cell division protein ZapA [Alphaproteobacteria bacterium]|nr:cell division protein ZapA [Alphaproteobacteria bacterium]
MTEVVVTVNGRDFPLSCADGQEARTRRLAQYVDAKIGEFAKSLGQAGETRLLLLAALVIADELSDTGEALQQERNRPPAPEIATAERAAAAVSGIAERIEAIAAAIESA